MTIQISVLIWTVICFVLLMLILHNLLFKPTLQVMDERKRKIEAAAAKKEELLRAQQEYTAELERRNREQAEQQRKQVKENIEAIRAKNRIDIVNAQEKRLHTVDEYRVRTEKEHEEIIEALAFHATELAETFAESVVKG